MKYLETLKTRPHKYCNDISDAYLTDYLYDVFDVTMDNLDLVKDIFNMYSYMIQGERAIDAFISLKQVYILDEYELIIPEDDNILNAACSVAIKLTINEIITGTSPVLQFRFDAKTEFVKDLMNLDFATVDKKYMQYKISSFMEVVDISSHELVLPGFKTKLAKREFTVINNKDLKSAVGHILLDFSGSMYANNLNYFKLFVRNIPFKKYTNLKLYIYIVTADGIQFKGVVSTFEEFTALINSVGFIYGDIDIDKVLEFSRSLNNKVTFITDAYDFDIKVVSNINQLNTIILNGNNEPTIIK